VYLPTGEGGAKVGLDDYLAAGHTVEDLLGLASDEIRTPAKSVPPVGALPSIDAGDMELSRVSERAWGAIRSANEPPRIFAVGGVLSRLGADRDDDRPAMQDLN